MSLDICDRSKTLSRKERRSTRGRVQVSAYGSVVARPDGSRVFALWVQNVNNVSHVPGGKPSNAFRADMLGNFVWKYSDDEGRTWSDDHFVIPVPYGYIESINTFSKTKGGPGDVQIMWEVDHVKVLDDLTVMFASEDRRPRKRPESSSARREPRGKRAPPRCRDGSLFHYA